MLSGCAKCSENLKYIKPGVGMLYALIRDRTNIEWFWLCHKCSKKWEVITKDGVPSLQRVGKVA
jgi:hypothetical protein